MKIRRLTSLSYQMLSMFLNNIQKILAVGRTSWVLMPAVAFKSYNWKLLNEKIFYYSVLKSSWWKRYATRIYNEK